ncbi:glycosyltransferase family 2 protein [soil metagenome]
MTHASPKVFILLLNWNGWQDTLDCLTSLTRLAYPNFETIVVDNGSENGSEEKIRAAFPDTTLLQSGANLGFAGGNNVGLKYALRQDFDFVWLLNNDTVVEPDALSRLVERTRNEPEVDMCGSTLVYHHDRDTVQAYGGGTYNQWLGLTQKLGHGRLRSEPVDAASVERKLDYIEASSLLVSRRFLATVGLMKEDYFLYYEEIDWVARAGGRFKLGYAKDSVVYHKEGASIGGSDHAKTQKSWTADYYSVRNRILITRRFFPKALPTVYLSLGGVVLNRLRRRQWRRVKMVVALALGGGNMPRAEPPL